MGRYYSGDIEGKFAFAIQSSDDADFFGVTGTTYASPLTYEFEKDDLDKVKKGIEKCEEKLVEFKPKLNEFFEDKQYYNREELQEFMGVDEDKVKDILEWDARLTLGKQIKECIEKTGQCHFEAEA